MQAPQAHADLCPRARRGSDAPQENAANGARAQGRSRGGLEETWASDETRACDTIECSQCIYQPPGPTYSQM